MKHCWLHETRCDICTYIHKLYQHLLQKYRACSRRVVLTKLAHGRALSSNTSKRQHFSHSIKLKNDNATVKSSCARSVLPNCTTDHIRSLCTKFVFFDSPATALCSGTQQTKCLHLLKIMRMMQSGTKLSLFPITATMH